MSQYEMVYEFHETYKLVCEDEPIIYFDPDLVMLRENLHREEFRELDEAMASRNLVEIADALADLIYVLNGTAVSFGIPLDKVFREVHESNMSKLDENGEPIFRSDGKVLKGPNYRPPDLEKVIYG